jgi:hypothetical protein
MVVRRSGRSFLQNFQELPWDVRHRHHTDEDESTSTSDLPEDTVPELRPDCETGHLCGLCQACYDHYNTCDIDNSFDHMEAWCHTCDSMLSNHVAHLFAHPNACPESDCAMCDHHLFPEDIEEPVREAKWYVREHLKYLCDPPRCMLCKLGNGKIPNKPWLGFCLMGWCRIEWCPFARKRREHPAYKKGSHRDIATVLSSITTASGRTLPYPPWLAEICIRWSDPEVMTIAELERRQRWVDPFHVRELSVEEWNWRMKWLHSDMELANALRDEDTRST